MLNEETVTVTVTAKPHQIASRRRKESRADAIGCLKILREAVRRQL